MTWHLQRLGHRVNIKRVRRLMRLLGLMPIYQKPNTSAPHPGHKRYPYLLGGLSIIRPNHVLLSGMKAYPAGRRVRRYHICSAGAGLPQSGCHHGLGKPLCAGLASERHHGSGFLRRCSGRITGTLRVARDIQHRSGQPVHFLSLDRSPERSWRLHLNGR